jgi:hypothetical protein
MPEWVFYLWIFPIELLLIVWAAFIVLGVKGLIFNREPGPRPRPRMPAEYTDPETGEVIPIQGMGWGCSMCLIFVIWPLILASKIDDWLPPPKSN